MMAAERTEIDPSDPLERDAQTFPVLSAEMVVRMTPYGHEEAVAGGTALYRRGDRNVDFFVVLEGAIEVLDADEHGVASVFTTHRAHQFTGELTLFNERETLLTSRASEDSRVLRVSRANFRHMVSAEADIGEIIMRAFILRRVGLIKHAHGGVTLVGSAHAADTLRLQRFLTRNAYPHRLLDTDTDPDADGFLESFAVKPGELPVVIGAEGKVLRNPATPALADALGLTETLDPARIHDVVVVGASSLPAWQRRFMPPPKGSTRS